MDYLSFISSLIDSLAWPITAVAIVFILRQPFSGLIRSIRRIEGRGVVVDFGEEIESLNKQVDRELIPLVEGGAVAHGRPEAEYQRTIQNYYDIAIEDSRAAIMNAWLLIEEAARDLAKRKNLEIRHYPPSIQILRLLHKKNIITSTAYKTIDQARNIRNKAVHTIDFTISSDDAQNYIATAEKISSYLRSIN